MEKPLVAGSNPVVCTKTILKTEVDQMKYFEKQDLQQAISLISNAKE